MTSLNRSSLINEISQIAPKVNISYTDVVYKRMRDPALLKFYYSIKTRQLLDSTQLEGSSPPDIFVGRLGYPKVFIGPLVPPMEGDTSLLGTPEMWVGKNIPEIVEMRTQLVRGMFVVNVKDVDNGKITEVTKELALSKKHANVELELSKKPYHIVRLDDQTQPFGPSAPLKDVSVSGTLADQKIEKIHNDTDLKAANAIVSLYEKGILVSKIQKALSAGLFGLSKNRKFVPTRWSITAVDDTLGKNLLRDIKHHETIDEFRIYEIEALDNRWEILMMPQAWSYELIEAWYPGTLWNMESRDIAMYASSEGFSGRKAYAEIGGCYYAARLAVAELLEKEKRQASVIILRESHPGYIMPVGVWNVREHVRAALKTKSLKFDTLEQAISRIKSRLEIPLKNWIKASKVLKEIRLQKKVTSFV